MLQGSFRERRGGAGRGEVQWRLAAVSGPKVDRPLHHVYGSFLLSEPSGREADRDEAEFPLLNCTVVRDVREPDDAQDTGGTVGRINWSLLTARLFPNPFIVHQSCTQATRERPW